MHSSRRSLALLVAALTSVRALACSSDEDTPPDRVASSGSAGTSSEVGGSGGNGGDDGSPVGGAGSATTGGTAGAATAGGAAGANETGGQGGEGGAPSTIDAILAALRADRDAALLAYSKTDGWPLAVEGGFLFVSTDVAFSTLTLDGASQSAMQVEDDFAWVVVSASAGAKYAFSDGATTVSDAWSRSYNFDPDIEVSLVAPTLPHLDRHFGVSDAVLAARTVRVWVPAGAATHVLYAQDGQNLFDPTTLFGGWQLQETAPATMMVVGIDNTADRNDEYTHVQDAPSGDLVGGLADAYAGFLEDTVRPLIAAQYGEPARRGLLGSSLGGLLTLYVAHTLPASYDFAASLSGTVGWGSIATDVHNQTILELYAAAEPTGVVLYLDSGGSNSTACSDADGDGIEDDSDNGDDYCENAQLYSILKGIGYADGVDVHYYFEAGAQHNEAAWAARVAQPLAIFDAL